MELQDIVSVLSGLVGVLLGGWISRSTSIKQARIAARNTYLGGLIDTVAEYQVATLHWVTVTTGNLSNADPLASFDRSVRLKEKLKMMARLFGSKDLAEAIQAIEKEANQASQSRRMDLKNHFASLHSAVDAIVKREIA
jgi:hypothetical protein